VASVTGRRERPPALQGRPDDFFHVIPPGQLIEKELGLRQHALGRWREEGLPDGVGEGVPPGSRVRTISREPLKMRARCLNLGGLSRPFDASQM
jgi:hypothetical protein